MKSPAFRRLVLGLLCAIVLLFAAALLLPGLLSAHPDWVERWYAGKIYPAITVAHARWIGHLPVSIGELALYGLIALGIGLLVWAIVLLFRKNFRRLLLLALSLCLFGGAMWLQFYAGWAFSHNRQPLAVSLGLDTAAGNTEELSALCSALCAEAKALRTALTDETGALVLPETDEMLAAVPSYYEALGKAHSLFSQPVGAPKPVLWSEGLSYLGITGIYLPFTHESNVNVHQSAFLIAATAAHECAHQQGIAREDEANFAAYLACDASGDDAARYSGTMLALIYCGNALAKADPDAYAALAAQYSDGIRSDLRAHSAYWKRYEGKAEEIASAANDSYLKSHGQTAGVQSYGRMADLMLATYRAGWILR